MQTQTHHISLVSFDFVTGNKNAGRAAGGGGVQGGPVQPVVEGVRELRHERLVGLQLEDEGLRGHHG